MYLGFSQDNIDIFTINTDTTQLPEKYDLWDFFIQISSKDLLKHRRHFSWYSDIRSSKGIYLGSNDHINNLLNSIKDDKKDYTNIFVEPLTNVPREDLKDRGIIRKRNLENSEVAIVPKSCFTILKEPFGRLSTAVLHNTSTNRFLIITDLYSGWWTKSKRDEFNKYFNYKSIEEFIDLLFKYNIISEDYHIFFIGNVLNIKNDKDESFIINLNKYKNIIFEKDYNDYLNRGKEVLTLNMLNSIENLLKSHSSNYDIGLQMLYPFDPKPYAYTIATIINSRISYRGIQYCSFWKSTKFKKYLSLIGLDRSKFPYDKESLRKNTFDICGPEDKEKIVSEIFDEAKRSIIDRFLDIKKYNFLEDANLEPPKFIYNEKDYYNSRKQK